MCTHQAFLGGFKHLGNIPPPEIPEVIKWNYIMQGVGITSFTPPKLAVGLLILRVIDRKSIGWRHYSIWALMVFVFLLNALATIFTYVQCNPTEALWDRRLMATAKCWNPNVQKNFSLFQACESNPSSLFEYARQVFFLVLVLTDPETAGNVFADVVLAVMPITVIAGLRMPMQRRVALCILLGLGLLAAVAGSVKATYLASLTERSDITCKSSLMSPFRPGNRQLTATLAGETYNLVVWSGAENFVVIVCGSVPPLKPFYDKYISDNRLFTFASAWSKSGSNASTSRDYLKRSSPSAMESGRGNYYSKNSIKVGTSVSVSSSYADKESL